MKQSTFENLYDEYESQRRDELRFLAEKQDIRTPYTQPKEKNTMNNEVIVLNYKSGAYFIFEMEDFFVIDEIIADREIIQEIYKATRKSEGIQDHEQVVLLGWKNGRFEIYKKEDSCLLDTIIENFDLIEEAQICTYYKGE